MELPGAREQKTNIIDIGQFLICLEERSFIQGLQGAGHEPSSGFWKPDLMVLFDRSNSVQIVFFDRSDLAQYNTIQ